MVSRVVLCVVLCAVLLSFVSAHSRSSITFDAIPTEVTVGDDVALTWRLDSPSGSRSPNGDVYFVLLACRNQDTRVQFCRAVKSLARISGSVSDGAVTLEIDESVKWKETLWYRVQAWQRHVNTGWTNTFAVRPFTRTVPDSISYSPGWEWEVVPLSYRWRRLGQRHCSPHRFFFARAADRLAALARDNPCSGTAEAVNLNLASGQSFPSCTQFSTAGMFYVRYHGFLRVGVEGNYKFVMRSTSGRVGGRVRVNRASVVVDRYQDYGDDDDDDDSLVTRTGYTVLCVGMHEIEVELFVGSLQHTGLRLSLEYKLQSPSGHGDLNVQSLLTSAAVLYPDASGGERHTRAFFHTPRLDTRAVLPASRLGSELATASRLAVCLWLRTLDQLGTLFAYSTTAHPHAFVMTVTGPTQLTVTVAGTSQSFDTVTAFDAKWHLLCSHWNADAGTVSVSVDGAVGDSQTDAGWQVSGSGARLGGSATDTGCVTLAQAPDPTTDGGLCSTFLPSHSYEGYLSGLSVWTHELTDDDETEDDDDRQLKRLVLSQPDLADANLVLYLHSYDPDAPAYVDASPNEYSFDIAGIAWPTFFDKGTSFEPPEDSIQLRMTFDTESLALSASTEYPTGGVGADPPTYVVDQSTDDNTARVLGDVDFGTYGGNHRLLSVMSVCNTGQLAISSLGSRDWNDAFTVAVAFRRTVGGSDNTHQSVVGNGFEGQSSFEIRMPPPSTTTTADGGGEHEDIVLRLSQQGGTGDKLFRASAARGEWHFAALTKSAATGSPARFTVTSFVDGQYVTTTARGRVPTRTTPLLVGAASQRLLHAFCGQLQEVRVYNRSLSHTELTTLWAELSHKQQFGDGTRPDCVVSEWSEWSDCQPAAQDDGEGGTIITATVKSRTRVVTSGSVACPALQELQECDRAIVVSTTSIQMSSSEVGVFNVSLTAPPRSDGVVVVTLDTQDWSEFMAMSACSLTFTPWNWHVPQTVSVYSRITHRRGTVSKTILLTATGYSGVLALPPTDAETTDVDVDSGGGTTTAVVVVDGTTQPDSTAPVTAEVDVSLQYGPGSFCTSFGDPHIVTFDRVGYDFQLGGTFYLALSQGGEFAVQVRQYQCRRNVACNDAVAIKYHDSVIVIYRASEDYEPCGGDPICIVSDTLHPGISVFRIPSRGGPKYFVVLPDGSYVDVFHRSWANNRLLNVKVAVPQLRKHGLAGLCGSYDGNKENDMMGRDGVTYGRAPHRGDKRRNELGETWAVPSNENLFNDPRAVIPAQSGTVYGTQSAVMESLLSRSAFGSCLNGEIGSVPLIKDPVRPHAQAVDITQTMCHSPIGQAASATPTVTPTPTPSPPASASSVPLGWADRVEEYCTELFITGALPEVCCPHPDIDCQSYYEDCILDCLETIDLAIVSATYEAFLEACVVVGVVDDPECGEGEGGEGCDFPIVPTPSNTPSGSNTPTRSVTPTPSITLSPTSSESLSPTGSVSHSRSPSDTRTPSTTNTASHTPTGSVSESNSRSPTSSVSESPTSTPSLTSTASESREPSQSLTPTPTVTHTPTRSPTLSLSNTPTVSDSSSTTPSMTNTATHTPSNTRTPSTTNTRSPSSTRSPTRTPSKSSSKSLTPARSVSPTGSVSHSGSRSLTATGSKSVSRSGSTSMSATASTSLSRSPSLTATASQSDSPTGSVSMSSTRTATMTPTRSPSDTNSPSDTPASSSTRSPSMTGSTSHSATRSASDSNTNTATHTPTGSVSMSNTNTATSSVSETCSTTPSTTRTASVSHTLTPSRTPTGSVSESSTSSISHSPTGSVSESSTSTPSMTRTASVSHTRTASRTLTTTASESSTSSISLSPTGSVSESATSTPSLTSTASETREPSVSLTPTPTISESPTSSISLSPTGSVSLSRTPTTSVSLTATASHTSAPSNSGTSSVSESSTSSISHSPTGSVSRSSSPTCSVSLTATASHTAPPSTSGTSSISESSTSSTSHSSTGSVSHTRTATGSVSLTATASHTAPPSATASATQKPFMCGTGVGSCVEGECCSQYNFCGTDDDYCLLENGCQVAFGHCASASPTPTVSLTMTASGTHSVSRTGTASRSYSSTRTATRSVSHSGTSSTSMSNTNTATATSSTSMSNTASRSHTSSITPTPTVSQVPVIDILELCPAMCSGSGDCTSSGCVCHTGFTGDDCSQELCLAPEVHRHAPVHGFQVTGDAVLSVSGKCLTTSSYTCGFTWVEADTGAVQTVHADPIIVSDYGLECHFPSYLTSSMYGNSSMSACTLPEDGFQTLSVTLTDNGSGGSQLVHANYTVQQCNPWAADGNTGCAAGSRCSVHGMCLCPFGVCGAFCQRQVPAGSGAACDLREPSLLQYHAMVQEDWTGIGGSDVEGLLAVGRDTHISHYSVGYVWPAPEASEQFTLTYPDSSTSTFTTRNDLVSCGSLTFVSGRVHSGGNVVYGDPESAITPDLASVDLPGKFLQSATCPVQFDDAWWILTGVSEGLAAMPRTGTTVFRHTRLTLKGTLPDVNVFRIAARDLLTVTDLVLDLPARHPDTNPNVVAVINVMFEEEWTGAGPDPEMVPDEWKLKAEDVSMDGMGLSGLFADEAFLPNVIWNFPYAVNMTVANVGVMGSILAPHAYLDFPYGEVLGSVWAKGFEGRGQVNHPMFGRRCPIVTVSDLGALGGGEGDFGADPLPPCSVYGRVEEDSNECECWDPTSYKGADCSQSCASYCNGRGRCSDDDPEVCVCWDPVRWTGDRCEVSVCGEHGLVIQEEPEVVCGCAPGWNGPGCSIQMTCVWGTFLASSDPPKCVCQPGYSGPECTIPVAEPIQCYHGEIVGTQCVCRPGWEGTHCAQSKHHLCHHGYFDATNTFCICDSLWAGEMCDTYTCMHGDRVETGEDVDGSPTYRCDCHEGWYGPDCGSHCEAVCNYRGSICVDAPPSPSPAAAATATGGFNESHAWAPSVVSSGSATGGRPCVCHPGFYGEQCESFDVMAAGNTTVNVDGTVTTEFEDDDGGYSMSVTVPEDDDATVVVDSGSGPATQETCESDGAASEVDLGCLPLAVTVTVSSGGSGRRRRLASDDGLTVVVAPPEEVGDQVDSDNGESLVLRNVDDEVLNDPDAPRCMLGSDMEDYDPVTNEVTFRACSNGTYVLRMIAPVPSASPSPGSMTPSATPTPAVAASTNPDGRTAPAEDTQNDVIGQPVVFAGMSAPMLAGVAGVGGSLLIGVTMYAVRAIRRNAAGGVGPDGTNKIVPWDKNGKKGGRSARARAQGRRADSRRRDVNIPTSPVHHRGRVDGGYDENESSMGPQTPRGGRAARKEYLSPTNRTRRHQSAQDEKRVMTMAMLRNMPVASPSNAALLALAARAPSAMPGGPLSAPSTGGGGANATEAPKASVGLSTKGRRATLTPLTTNVGVNAQQAGGGGGDLMAELAAADNVATHVQTRPVTGGTVAPPASGGGGGGGLMDDLAAADSVVSQVQTRPVTGGTAAPPAPAAAAGGGGGLMDELAAADTVVTQIQARPVTGGTAAPPAPAGGAAAAAGGGGGLMDELAAADSVVTQVQARPVTAGESAGPAPAPAPVATSAAATEPSSAPAVAQDKPRQRLKTAEGNLTPGRQGVILPTSSFRGLHRVLDTGGAGTGDASGVPVDGSQSPASALLSMVAKARPAGNKQNELQLPEPTSAPPPPKVPGPGRR